ncbi:MAG: DNA-binding domain-containing protein [Hyphomicrobium sp.]|jgi:hypothetical protein
MNSAHSRPADVPSLAELQARFQAAVMGGDNEILALVPGNSRTSNEVLLGVYRHAYVWRLVGVIKADHPVLAAYMEDESFEPMAEGYIAAHPSRSRNARWFSHKVPEFLQDRYSAYPELAEIAALERALSDAFDAPDAAVLSLAGLAAYPPERWGDLSFSPHASCTLLHHKTNAFQIWQALKDGGEAPSKVDLDNGQTLLAWRRDGVPTVRVLGPEEAMMWTEAQRGVPFGRLCELLAVFDDPETAALRAAQHLQAWITSEALGDAALRSARETA